MKKLIFLIVIFYQSAYAQSISRHVIASGSQSSHLAQSSLYIDWTIGEPIVNTITNRRLTITQGFEQPTLKGHPDPILKNKKDVLSMTLFPNPVKNYLTCKFKLEEHDQGTLILSDLNGKIIKKIKVEGKDNSIEINLSNLKPGFYYLTLSTKNEMITKKILKK